MAGVGVRGKKHVEQSYLSTIGLVPAFAERLRAAKRQAPFAGATVPNFFRKLATLEPPPPEMQQLFAAIHGNQAAMDAFVRMNAGTISPAEFFAPENVGAMMAGARVGR